MAFDRDNKFKDNTNNRFQRNENIANSVMQSEQKDMKENVEAVPVTQSKNRRLKPKKQYMMLNFYPDEKIKLRRLANQQGISASEYIEKYLKTLPDPGPEWDQVN